MQTVAHRRLRNPFVARRYSKSPRATRARRARHVQLLIGVRGTSFALLRALKASPHNRRLGLVSRGLAEIMAASASSVKQSIAAMPQILSGDKKSAFLGAFRDLVSKRAYRAFEEMGRADGDDLSHWLRAEEEVCMRLPEVRQSGAWYAVSASVRVPADRIRISVDEDAALISADTEVRDGESQERESVSKYYAIRWPESVNPQTASAYLKNGTLTLVARKASAAIAEVRELSAAKPGNPVPAGR
jgi:HSP20 family molecular chaperone IbpA